MQPAFRCEGVGSDDRGARGGLCLELLGKQMMPHRFGLRLAHVDFLADLDEARQCERRNGEHPPKEWSRILPKRHLWATG